VGSFGDKFRQAREAKGISLDDVSNVTKISARMLQAIEQEHFDQLPGGVFNKGFIRAYAKHLGLNDEDAITSYLACLRQSQIDAQQQAWQLQSKPPAPARPGVSEKSQPEKRPPQPYTKPAMTAQPPVKVEPDQAPDQIADELPNLQLPRAEDIRPPRRYLAAHKSNIPWNIVAAVAVVILLLALLWTRHSPGTRTEAAATPATSNPPSSNPTPQPPAHEPSTATQPSTAATPKSPNNAAQNSQPNPTATNSPATNPTTIKPATKSTDDTPGNDVTVRTFPPAKPAKPAPSFTLVIRAAENSWVNITADGQSVAHEDLIAPAATSVHATREIVARIGNSAGVTFLWHGEEIPAQGAESEVKTFVFDSAGMREVPNQPPAQNR
jgi:cytoskeletal protein RodZ